MGSGQKAWAEELEERAWEESVLKFNAIPMNTVVNNITQLKENINYIINSNPSLTRVQWAKIESCLEICKYLV
jgi:hypothetical protein